jgi:hypothetical protein
MISTELLIHTRQATELLMHEYEKYAIIDSRITLHRLRLSRTGGRACSCLLSENISPECKERHSEGHEAPSRNDHTYESHETLLWNASSYGTISFACSTRNVDLSYWC